MILRSLLFVPGDSATKLGKAEGFGADALILDLEDSVAPGAKPAARDQVAAYLQGRPAGARNAQLWVRINSLESPHALADLAAIIPLAPDGVVLPKAIGVADVVRLEHYIDALEAHAKVPPGTVKVMPIAAESPAAALRLDEYARVGLSRLHGMTWGAEDLAAVLGGGASPGDGWSPTLSMVRSLMLLAAYAADVQAIETVYADIRDTEGLANSCKAARREGFTGRIAIHPAQVEIINTSFTPSATEVAAAHRVIDAFSAAEGAGTIAMDGRMLDVPHLKRAQRTIATADTFDSEARRPR